MEDPGYHKIENYLLGRMNEKEKKLFEQQIQADKNLHEKVAKMRNAINILEIAGDNDLQKEIKEVQDQFFNNRNSKRNSRRIIPWILAAVITAFLISTYFFSQPMSPQEIYADNYQIYSISYASRNDMNNLETQLAKASQFYQQKDYQATLNIIEKIADPERDSKLNLMLALCYLEVNQSDKALVILSDIIKIKDPVFQYHAIWYSAMIYLKNDNISEAKIMLQLLANANNINGVYHKEEAIQILKNL